LPAGAVLAVLLLTVGILPGRCLLECVTGSVELLLEVPDPLLEGGVLLLHLRTERFELRIDGRRCGQGLTGYTPVRRWRWSGGSLR
jgi:hypothetical protein